MAGGGLVGFMGFMLGGEGPAADAGLLGTCRRVLRGEKNGSELEGILRARRGDHEAHVAERA